MPQKKYSIFIFILIFLTILGVIFFSTHADKEVHNAITNEFMKNLLAVSNGSVLAIKNDIESTKRTLKHLIEEVHENDYDFENKGVREDFLRIYNDIDFISKNDIGYMDEKGILKYSINAPQLIGKDFSFRKYYDTIKTKMDSDYLDVQFITFKGVTKGRKGLLFSMGVFEEDKESGKPDFNGIVLMTTDLRSFIDKYIKPLTIGKGGFMWFFESGREVLYHPKITKGESYQLGESELMQAEQFRGVLRDISEKNVVTGFYNESDESYVYASTPFKIGGKIWHFVVSVPEAETYSILRRYKASYTLTTISAFIVILFGFFLIFTFYIRERHLIKAVDIQSYQLEYAKKVNEELDTIISTIAHDLKTPLTSVMGFSQQVLEKSFEHDIYKEDMQYLSKVYLNANYMKELIDSLLEFSRIGKVASIIEDIPLTDLLREVRAQLHYDIEKRNAQVNIPDDLPVVQCDRLKMHQAFTNLISNAIKYVPQERSPVINIGFTETDECYDIMVKDNGIGIDKDEIADIFKIYHRAKSVDAPGTGVGLAIVKKIIEELNGEVRVESEKGVGSTFTVSIRK